MTDDDNNSKFKLLSPKQERGKNKRNQKSNDTNNLSNRDIDFKAKEEGDIIKVPRCTYANDIKVKSTFFFCQCSSEDFYPVCKACAESCHADHKPGLKLTGVYICLCGKNNHVITSENNKRFQDKKISQHNQCFYSQFMKITPSRGYFRLEKDGQETILCSVCVTYCLDKSDTSELSQIDDDEDESQLYCECSKHYENNIINLNVDFLEKKHFRDHFQNFNFNILAKNYVSKEKYIDFLVTKIMDYDRKQNSETSFYFFTNVFVLKILTLYTEFNNPNTNKFFHISSFLKEFKTDTLLKLISFEEPLTMLNEITAPDFVISKMYFTGLIFNYLIKSFYNLHNILFKNKAILNMNVFQRVIYLLDSKHFYQFNPKKDFVVKQDIVFTDFASIVLDQYENILKLNDNINLQHEILENVFPIFTEIFKFLIKYNIISKELRMKYYELVLDTFVVIEKSEHYFGSELNIMKALFYSLVYINDLNFMDYIRTGNEDETLDWKKKFCFLPCAESDTISKIFVKIINKIKRNNDFKKTLRFDGYITKILELLIGKSDLFTISIENLYCLTRLDIKMIDNYHSREVPKKILIGDKEKRYYDDITNIAMRMADNNRSYFEYRCNYLEYVRVANEIFKDFETFFEAETNNMTINLKNVYYIYADNISIDAEVTSNIYCMQKVFKYTTFIQRINEFLHIYSEAKIINYSSNRGENFIKISDQYLKLILNFFSVYLFKNNEGIFLIESLDGENMANTFFDVKEDFFNFMKILSYTFFTKTEADYKKENFAFYFSVFNTFMKQMYFDDSEPIETLFINLEILSKIININKRCIRFVSVKLSILFNTIECALDKLREIRNCHTLNRYIVDWIMGSEDEKEAISNELNKGQLALITKFAKNYFAFLNEIIKYDLFFLGLVKIEDFIFNLKSIDFMIKSDILDKIPITLKIEMMQLYLSLKLNYNFVAIDIHYQLDNLYTKYKKPGGTQFLFDNQNLSMLNLSKIKDEEKYSFEKIRKRYDNMIFYLQNFSKYFKSLANSIKSLIKKLTVLFSFYEFCIVRPINILINRYLINDENITGIESFSIYQLTLEFLKVTIFFYENIELINNTYNIEDEMEKSILNKRNLLNYEEIYVSWGLDKEILDHFSEDVKNLSQNIKYFELHKIIGIFKKTINIVGGLDLNPAEDEVKKNDDYNFTSFSNFLNTGQNLLSRGQSLLNSGLNAGQGLLESGQGLLSRGIGIKDVGSLVEGGLDQMKNLIGRTKTRIMGTISGKIKLTLTEKQIITNIEDFLITYRKKVDDSYGPKLSLIQVLNNNSESDEEIDLDLELYSYLTSKFCEELNPNNIARYKKASYQKRQLHELSIDNMQLQNMWCLNYLNKLFYNNSEKFQGLIMNEMEEDENDYFLKFLCKDLIFSCLINETKKNYDLDPFVPVNFDGLTTAKTFKETYSFEILSMCIKFLQNLCENHNQYFQNKLFDLDFCDLIQPKEVISSRDQAPTTTLNKKSTWGVTNTSGAGQKSFLLSYKNSMKSSTKSDAEQKKWLLNKEAINKVESDDEMDVSKDEVVTAAENRKSSTLSKQDIRKLGKNILQKKKYSFFNFICLNMRIILHQMHLKSTDILYENRLNKTYDNVKDIFKKFCDLLIEMIQGINEKNFVNFIHKLPKSVNPDEHNYISNEILEDNFMFVSLLGEIRHFVFGKEYMFDQMTIDIKYEIFLIITNLITSEVAPSYLTILKLLVAMLPPDEIITLIASYLKALYVRYILDISYSDKNFLPEFNSLEFTEENFHEIYAEFKTNIKISEDPYFRLSSQMYLFLVILGNLQNVPEAKRILELENQKIIFEYVSFDVVDENFMEKAKTYVTDFFANQIRSLGLGNQIVIRKKKKIYSHFNNEIIASKFFNRVVRSCEFLIAHNKGDKDEENDSNDKTLKKIYFIINPYVYLISDNNINTFFDFVDRKTSTSKLKALLDKLDTFCQEVKFKKERLGENPNLKWMLDINYKDVDFMNFILSVIINLILLAFLEGGDFEKTSYFKTITFIIYLQIFINMAYTGIFLFSKYKFYLIIEYEKFEAGGVMNFIQKAKVSVIDCFLLNDEISIMLLNILIGYLCLTTSFTTFLVSLQLFTVIKFVPTINEIVIAFRIRLGQLMSMIGFLAIIIFFYSNIGFFFINSEFNTVLDDGVKENLCSSLLECAVTYFNLGVRAGGGVGDLLQEKSIKDTNMYWIRWISDMIFYITVILLLMNMINGVIVSTFSQIREESQEKDDDINNNCFICSINRVEFEKRNIPFVKHLSAEHNSRNYIKFLVNLKLSCEKDLDSDQFYIIKCVKNNDVACFPVSKSLSLGVIEGKDEDNNEDESEGTN